MPDHYIQEKIKEALEVTGGDKRDAQKLLITWAVRDPSLLLGFAKPHLKAIVSAHIDQHTRPVRESEDAGNIHFTRKEIDKMVVAHKNTDKRAHHVPMPRSSARQASVMHQLAAAFKKKK